MIVDAAIPVVTIATVLTAGAISVFLLTRVFRTIVELRKITVGLDDVADWLVGNAVHESPARPVVQCAGGRRPRRGGSGRGEPPRLIGR